MPKKKLKVTELLSWQNIGVIVALGLVMFTYAVDTLAFYLNWIVAGLVIIIAFVYIFTISFKLKKSLLYTFILMSIWVSYAIIITPVAVDKNIHFIFIATSIFYNIYSIVMVNLVVKTEARLAITFYMLNLFWCIISLGALAIYLNTSSVDKYNTFSGIFFNRNQFAILTTLLFIVTLFNRSLFKNKIIINIVLLIDIIMIFMSVSRKGTLGLFLVLFLFYWQKMKWAKKIVSIIIVVVFIVTLFIFKNPLQDRFQLIKPKTSETKTQTVEVSAFERIWFILEGTKVFLENPLTGIGVNNSKYYLVTPIQKLQRHRGVKKDNIGKYTHNNYLEMLLNGGIPTYLLYYIPIFFVLIKVMKTYKTNENSKQIMILIYYKLFLDIAMVSYTELSHTILLAYVFIQYFYSQKNMDVINTAKYELKEY